MRGNHDALRPGRRDVTGEILAGAGIRLIANEWVALADGLVLAGIDDLTSSSRRPGEGEINFAGMTLIVSRGTGTWGPRMRLWATGESPTASTQGFPNMGFKVLE